MKAGYAQEKPRITCSIERS